MHPASPAYPNSTGSVMTGVFAGLQSGYALTTDPPGVLARAVLWSDSPTGWTDLHPLNATESEANGVYNAQELGTVHYNDGTGGHAGVWYNSANSFVDLRPLNADDSQGLGVYNGKQVGYVELTGQSVRHASLWSNTQGSWVDLQPAAITGVTASTAYSVFDNSEVGDATIGGSTHASYWNGSSGSWVDLHQFLPAGYTDSTARDVYITPGGTTYVTGWAVNGAGQNEAYLWTLPVPEPAGGVMVLLLAGGGVLARRPRC